MLRAIYILAWPSIVEQILQTVVQYVDFAMVGRIGASASATVGLTTSVTWLINAPMFAVGIGLLANISRSLGAGNADEARKTGIQAVFLTLILGILIGTIMLAVSPSLPRWLNAEPVIQEDASRYFAIICAPMLFRAAILLFGSALRGSGDTKSPMLANLCMNAANILLNFFLIYPSRRICIGSLELSLFGADMGVTGAAAATAVSYCIGGILMIAAYRKNKVLSPRGLRLRMDRKIMGKCLRIGIPVALERIITCLGYVTFTSLVSRLGTIDLAAHSIALTAEEAFYLPGYGMQAAASTLAGNSLGEGNQQKFRQVTRLTCSISVLIMTFTGFILFLVPGVMMSIFTSDLLVIQKGSTILRLVSVSEPLFAAVIILEGIFNGIGDTKAPFYCCIFSMWGIRIIGACLCLFVLHTGLTSIWICMIADNVTRFFLLAGRYLKGSWKKRFADTGT